jgi:hypothetical protein
MTNKEIDSLAQRLEDYFYHFKDYTMFDFDMTDEDMAKSIEQRKIDLTDIEEVDRIIFNVRDCNQNLDDSHSEEATALISLLQKQRDFLAKNSEKRMVSNTGYEVKQTFRIGGKEILLAENMNAENNMFYLVCDYKEYGIIAEYSPGVISDDYLEALQDFTSRISTEMAALQADIDARGLPSDLFTAEHCYPRSYEESIEGKVVVIKSSVFSPEYRRGENQLVLAVDGNGARANPNGQAVYCYHLNDGNHTRFERHDVLGVIKPEALPDWAKESLARIQGEKDKPAEEKEYAGNYEIIERIPAGQKVFVLGHNAKAPQPYGTWQGYKNSHGNFDWGHYFSDYEAAKTDMHDRAAKERQRLDTPKRSDKDGR